jgi:uncharacterized protein YbjT (DUF2867 family)
MKIVVVGSSGLIGSKLVAMLSHDGHEVLAASRRSGVDVVSGEGLAEAVRGASIVIDVTNSPPSGDAAMMKFFKTSTHNLLTCEVAAGVRHHITLSLVGTGHLLQSGYFRAKFAQERLVRESSVLTRSSKPVSCSSSWSPSPMPLRAARLFVCRRH